MKSGRSTRNWRTDVEPSRLARRDLLAEALAGIIQRPGRSVLTMLGTVLGVGAFVAILGLTATASGQIGHQFTVLAATTVTITTSTTTDGADTGQSTGADETGEGTGLSDFPADADQRITRLNGAVAAGVWWPVNFNNVPIIGTSPTTQSGSSADIGSTTKVFAASPGLLPAIQALPTHGVLFDAFHDARGEPVCVIGRALSQRLGITQLDTQPALFINGTAFTVIGIIGDTAQLPEMLLGVIIPRGTAERFYGSPGSSGGAQMLIHTQLGAAKLIARQAPLALRPDNPAALAVVPPPDPHSLRDKVSTDLTGLFLVLATICLIIGTVGIANTTFVAVLERTGEIGLRRALGARSRHIASQFLAESVALGLLGGMLGTSLAVATVITVALVQGWTAILDPMTVAPAPFIGAATGLLAGLYPALRAARIEPQEALRR
ncbi:MAG: transporter [Actinomycetia bacterium]|nr:transporter [Actinomycetes bacterium]